MGETRVEREPGSSRMRQQQPLLRRRRIKRDPDSLQHHATPSLSLHVGELLHTIARQNELGFGLAGHEGVLSGGEGDDEVGQPGLDHAREDERANGREGEADGSDSDNAERAFRAFLSG